MKLNLFSLSAKPSTMTVSDALFGADINLELIAQAVHVYRSNLRQAGAKALTRGEVSRTGAKWFRQKGTGNARHGARTAPQFVGGGVAHGPTGMENWKRTLPKKMARKATIAALSAQAQENQVSILADLGKVAGKTKQAQELLAAVGQKGTLLLVINETTDAAVRAFSNLNNVSLTRADRLNALEVASADHILVLQSALETLENRLVAGKATKTVTQAEEAKPAVKKAPAAKTAPKAVKTAKKPAAKAKKAA